jgi:hypothetical protein
LDNSDVRFQNQQGYPHQIFDELYVFHSANDPPSSRRTCDNHTSPAELKALALSKIVTGAAVLETARATFFQAKSSTKYMGFA